LPAGAEPIFNSTARIAWWEGPPFGGGQWHAECRGDARTFNSILADFAKLDVKTKRLVVHDGVGRSFWLNPNDEPAKREGARIDWMFMVWQPASWERLRKLPADLNPTGPGNADDGPPTQIDVYTGGSIKWADVVVPKGLKVIDQRLEAHGFTPADGVVLEGKVTDLATKKPIPAKSRLERIEPQKQGGYQYTTATKAATDADGHWVMRKVAPGWYRVVIEADGYVPRILGYLKPADQPRWHGYDGGLARPAPVTGRITDDTGRPLADVEVRFDNVTTNTGLRYELPRGSSVNTGADGRFRAEQLPAGKVTIWVHKPGYIRPGLGLSVTTPKEDVELKMVASSRVVVTVDFTGKERPKGYVVHIAPEGGEAVGKYGGSGQINDNNEITFEHVPPGRYVLHGRPNPGSDDQQTDPVTVELQGGKTTVVTLPAK
jgi:hypothetical protein